MQTISTVSEWIDRAKNGSETAFQNLWLHFLGSLTGRLSSMLRGTKKTTFDVDDVLIDACDVCFRKLRDGQYPKIKNRKDLWALLITIAERKAIERIRKSKTGLDGHLNQVSFIVKGDGSDYFQRDFAQAETFESSPELAVLCAEELQLRYEMLKPKHAEIAKLRLAGYTVQEVADEVGISKPTVERYLRQIREIWTDAEPNSEDS